MNERLRKARRILAVQTALDRLADWRVREIEFRERALQDRRRELVGFLDGESAFTALFASTVMRRMEGLVETLTDLSAERQERASRRLEERGRTRSATRLVDALEAEARRLEERRRLAEAIESVNDDRR